MGDNNWNDNNGDLREFDENPFNPEKSSPEQVARIFYMNDVTIIPVVSKRGILLGILKKEDVISELSDLERVKNQKIDQFTKKLARKMTLDELLPLVGNVKEFVAVNLFGEVYGKWTRLKLFAACEQGNKNERINDEIEKQKDDQILEWMIYLILEHIPRALYALNSKNKTIFYNSYFEEIFKTRLKRDVDIKYVENSLNDPNKNELFTRDKNNSDVYFYNMDLQIYYQKVPLLSKNKTVGFLICCDNNLNRDSNVIFPGINMEKSSLKEKLEATERLFIVEAIRKNNHDLIEAARMLKISRQFMNSRIEKYAININTSPDKKKQTT